MSSHSEQSKLKQNMNNKTEVEYTKGEQIQTDKNIVDTSEKCFEIGTSPPVDIPCAPNKDNNQTNPTSGFFYWFGTAKNKTHKNDSLNKESENNKIPSIDNMSPESNASSEEVFKMDDLSLEKNTNKDTPENNMETKDEDTPGEESEESEESESDEDNTDFAEYENILDKFEEEMVYYKYGTFPYMRDFIIRWHNGNRYEKMVRYIHECNDIFLNGTMDAYNNNKDILAFLGFFSMLSCFGVLENFIFGYISYVVMASCLPPRPPIINDCQ